jgi:hypothetical protein
VSSQPGSCPRCGAPYAAGQEYCLECGLRLDTETGWFARFVAPWRRRRWYPGDWIWPVLLFLLVAALGAVVAILATGGSSGSTLVATSPATATGGGFGLTTTAAATLPLPTTAPPATNTPPPTRTNRPPVQRKVIEWPDRSGYTIVLESIPTTSGRAQANATARRALAAGLPQVGVLASSNYSSLQPGYYVVFSGVYGSNSDAEQHLDDARGAGFDFPYVRPVTT